jgi:hypothetical protein
MLNWIIDRLKTDTHPIPHVHGETARPVPRSRAKQPFYGPTVMARVNRLDPAAFLGGHSWLGGIPPVSDAQWPRAEAGGLMHPMASIDLSALTAAGGASALPKTGALCFFADVSEWPFTGKVIYVADPAPRQTIPADLPRIFNNPANWSTQAKGVTPENAPRLFPRWPVEFYQFDWPKGADEEEQRQQVLEAFDSQSNRSLSARHVFRDLPRNQSPWLWDSVQRFAASLETSLERLPDTIQTGNTLLQSYIDVTHRELATLKSDAETMNTATNPLTPEIYDKRHHTLSSRLGALVAAKTNCNDPDHQEAYRELVGSVVEWCRGQNRWSALSDEDHALFKDIFDMVKGDPQESQFACFYRWANCNYGYPYQLTSDTLQSMANAAPDVFNLLPHDLRHAIATETRLPYCGDVWHQMFGTGQAAQLAVEENASIHMLLQLASDQMMNWMWGDAGILHFWISDADLRTGNWHNAYTTIECH